MMNKYLIALSAFLLLAGCDDVEATSAGQAGQAGQATAGAGGGTNHGGAGGSGGKAAGISGSSGQAGSGGSTVGADCAEEIKTLLGPQESVSTGEVTVVKEESGSTIVYVDASAGGYQESVKNPRVYVDLVTDKRVDLTDVQASTSLDWDLSFKQAVVFTNSGDAGPGEGGAVFLPGKAFDQVSSGDATGLVAESFVGDDCASKLDDSGAVKTSLFEWYNYDMATHLLSPKAGVFVVKGAKGSLYKLEVLGFYGNPDGTLDGKTGGRFIVRIAAL